MKNEIPFPKRTVVNMRRDLRQEELLVLLFVIIVSNELVYAWPSLALNDLSPPPGNSLQLKLLTCNGKQTYGCFAGQWKLLNATAELVNAEKNTTIKFGSYYYSHRSHSGGTWSLINSPAVYAESGFQTSVVSGTEIASEEAGDGCSSALAEASDHKHAGIASTISYIQRFPGKTTGLLSGKKCKRGSRAREVPYEAEYWLWSQDKVPPADTPAEVRVSGEKLVEGFFSKGVVCHVYNGTAWEVREWKAKLYDVPGGSVVGQHSMKNSSTSLVWELFNPNGFGIRGSSSGGSVQVAENCMPWTLNHVTHTWGNASLLGPLSHVQMVSTRGGMPPSSSESKVSTSASPLEPLTPRPATGQVSNTTFSAVFWLYAR
ncbi:uncharacterized protein LOC9651220 [Selaginella moellendorffii]|uniref:uncharacterized protein LOC9651220 n=1 Tax=Selaginella moellendorffii TaxID=88036 RepID=UPI000D1CA3A7|nr:uncharacterized protein LOC9651220 [Selaginella moellendorffii]XP_024529798.1 uncharacterized protein LOC9651220 [Selaginella moellendorffii]|eukprot:XP_024529797.1 uncharacterized protein LOC9651220 [Selaginella moellendorffii]